MTYARQQAMAVSVNCHWGLLSDPAVRRRLARVGAAWASEDVAATVAAVAADEAIALVGAGAAARRRGVAAGGSHDETGEMLDKMRQVAALAREKMAEMRAAREQSHAA